MWSEIKELGQRERERVPFQTTHLKERPFPGVNEMNHHNCDIPRC